MTSELFSDWWKSTILVTEGQDHRRLCRLVNPSSSPKTVKGLMGKFESVANELIDKFIDLGQCDLMSDFANPQASRILIHLIELLQDVSKDILAV